MMYVKGERVFQGRCRKISVLDIIKVAPLNQVEENLIQKIATDGLDFYESLFRFRVFFREKWVFGHSVNELLEITKKRLDMELCDKL